MGLKPEDFRCIRRLYGEPREKFARRFPCNSGSIYNWEKGVKYPNDIYLGRYMQLWEEIRKEERGE